MQKSTRKSKWKSIIKQIGKTIVCLVLCISLVWGYSYKEPMQANAIGMEMVFGGLGAGAAGVSIPFAAGAAIVATGLGALGIGVSALVHGESYSDACGRIWNNMTAKAKTDIVIAGTAAAPVVHLGTDAIQGLNDSVSSALTQRATYDALIEGGMSPSAMSIASGDQYDIVDKIFSYPHKFGWFTGDLNTSQSLIIKDFKVIGKLAPGQIQFYPLSDGKCLKLYVDSASATVIGSMGVQLYDSLSNAHSGSREIDSGRTAIGGVYSSPSDIGVKYVPTFVSATIVAYKIGEVCKIGLISVEQARLVSGGLYENVPVVAWNDVKTGGASVTGSLKAIDDGPINVADKQFYARELSALNTKIDAMQSRLEAAQGQKAGKGIDVHPPVAPGLPLPTDKWWDKIRSQPQDKVLDIPGSTVTEQDKERNKITNKERDTTQVTDTDATPSNPSKPGDKPGDKPKEMPDLTLPEIVFKQKFPFCLPWDIYRIVSGFYCNNTQVPKWTIPIKNKRLGINSGITIDFSQFESVAALARWFNGAFWVVGLILMSRKMIGAGGGD